MKAKITLKNIIAYIQGKIRYKAYYSSFLDVLIRKHIKEQIDMRIKIMDKDCYTSGTCKLCGCSTTALQMADKPCDKPCYPPMMGRKQWKGFKEGTPFEIGNSDTIWAYKNGVIYTGIK